MATEKTVNYTESQVAQIVNGYKAGETVEALALSLGKSVKSVVAKLAQQKVYVAKTKQTSSRKTKQDLVNQIATQTNLDPKTLESLTKASHEALEAIATSLVFETE